MDAPRLRRSRVAAAAVASIVLATWLLVEPTLASAQHQPQADEGYYTWYMMRVRNRGLGAFPGLAEEWLARENNLYFPPPTRVGYAVAAAAWSSFAGTTYQDLARLSLASVLALVATQFLFARRHFGDAPAVLIAALTAASPLLLGMGRLALADDFASAWMVASLWLFLEVVRAPRSPGWSAAFAAAFTVALLSKEISLLLLAPMAAFALVEHGLRRRDPRAIARIAALLAAPVVASTLVWAWAAGGFGVLARIARAVASSPASNTYALSYGGGPWVRYCVDELLLSPWTSALGLAGLVVALWRWRGGEVEQAALFFALVYVLTVACLGPFTKNLRYAGVLEAPLRTLAVVLVWQACAAARSWRGAAAAGALTLFLAASDARAFHFAFVERGLFDPVSLELLDLRRMVPPVRR
jgi:4-amino-4-deoxy-L-arabinose transferase-like glycosyltransferase